MRIIRAVLSVLSICLLAEAHGALTREVYVWQRQLTPAVSESINAIRGKVEGVVVLAAEVHWSGKEPTLFKSSINYAQLAATGQPTGLVFRIGAYVGPFLEDDAVARYLAATAATIVKTAQKEGLTPTELQVDFDCSSSKLSGYLRWLNALRAAVAPTKLTFTALPDWLGREDFPTLLRAANGYILQVHSLEKPTGPDENFQLCDPDRSWAWIEKANRMGAPFRVALPTYGYRLAFDRTGKFLALAAEGSSRGWPEETLVRMVRANADAMAGLAAKITQEHPANCSGIIWFRLPVPSDELNWNLITLTTILDGKLPASQLNVEARWTSPALAEISLVNAGERDEELPAKIVARWLGSSPPQMMDGLGGYTAAMDGVMRDSVVMTAGTSLGAKVIAPGHSRKIAWLHFEHETILFSQIIPAP